MRKSSFLTVALFALPLTAASAAGGTRLEPIWTLQGLSAPESVAISADGSFLYVSNVNGEGGAVDGNGFISRVSIDGKMLQEKWATGLDGPKGLVLKGARLFVTDITRVVELDAASGVRVATHDVPGAKFLNDAALAPDGCVLVSDSDTGRISALKGGKADVFLEDPRLRSINGLLPETDRLVIVTMQGLLLAMDWKTRSLTEIAHGLGDGDGIAPLVGGHYLVSEWPGRIFDVAPDGSNTVLIDTRAEKKFLNDFTLAGDTLYVPHWEPGALTAYRLKY
jgi:ABC-type amino acid transport substrate-binding protein